MRSKEPQKRYECENCKSILAVGRDQDSKNLKCCKKPMLNLISTEYTSKEYKKISLENLEKLYNKHYHIEDFLRFELGWAVALSSKTNGEPLWIIFVGASGDSKSLQLGGMLSFPQAYRMHNLTSKTLVNGYKNKNKYPDLAPILNGKLICILDMAQILKLPPIEKGEVWGQLRDLYDGFAGKFSGSGSTQNYEDLRVTLIAGSTPSIDSQILVHQDLGTRELVYRTRGYLNKTKLIERIFKGDPLEESKIKEELKKRTSEFLMKREVKNINPPKKVLLEIEKIALFVSNLRVVGEFDQYTNELRNDVYPEEPTRITKQLLQIYTNLKSLDDDYPDERALSIMWHVGKSCCFPLRLKVFQFLESTPDVEFSTSKIAELLKIGKKTVQRECTILQVLDLIKCRWSETSFPDKFYYNWMFNKEKSHLKPSLNIVQYNSNNSTMYTLSGDGFGYCVKCNKKPATFFSGEGWICNKCAEALK